MSAIVSILVIAVLLLTLLGILIWRVGAGRFVLWLTGIAILLTAALGSLVALVALMNFAGIAIWAGAFIISLTLWVYVRRARHRALLKLLMLAIDKGIPLPAVVRASAADQWTGQRLNQVDLADNLARGVPLSAAAKMVGGQLSTEAIIAARMGEATGDLAGALRQVESSDDIRSPVQHALLGNTFYLLYPIFVVPALVTFFGVFIAPKIASVLDDFGVPMPGVSLLVNSLINSTPVVWAMLVVVLVGLAALAYSVLCYIEVAPLPYLGFGGRLQRSRVLRGLALAVGARRPLGENLAVLANSYPNATIARRLGASAQEVAAGANWISSMSKHHLIGRRDAAVIEAAQRVGNLPWALRELADSNERQMVYRLDTAMNVLAPFALLVWGAIILFLMVGFFMPLVVVIMSLAR
jgi:type II secretory pathway component PulF